MKSREHIVQSLTWRDPQAAVIATPSGRLRLTLSVGSGLAWDGERLWGLGDRGPNLKVKLAVQRYGLRRLAFLAEVEGAKIMPAPELGPQITGLSIEDGRASPGPSLRLTTPSGRMVSGRPLPGDDAVHMEPAYDLAGERLGADPDGADSEGLAAIPGGGFWVAEEYAPSLIRVDADGVCRARYVPAGLTLPGAEIPVFDTLPSIAARRRLNRGFEAVAMSPDGARLFAAFQSGLDRGGRAAGHARIWVLDPLTGKVTGQHLYPFDAPERFQRDGSNDPADLKICDLAVLDGGGLLVLERISRSAKLYRVDLGDPLPPEHLDPDHRPWLEEMTVAQTRAAGLPVLTKTLILDTDESDVIAPDLEGLAVLGPNRLILATDNDFGVEGAETRFFRVDFVRPLND